MARLDLGSPPQLEAPSYRDFRPWLDEGLFDRTCAYCLLHGCELAIDHYEPQAHAPARIHDPTNILLSCAICNGPGGKSDYHPAHAARRRLRGDTTGFMMVDVRIDDAADLYAVAGDGRIQARSGANRDRAIWTIEVLKLDVRARNDDRRELMDTLDSAERLLAMQLDARAAASGEEIALVLARLVDALARAHLFFHLLEIPLSDQLRARVDLARQRLLEEWRPSP